MHVLVTGGAGFIGSHLAKALVHNGWEVSVLDNLSTGKLVNVPAEARFFRGDILDRDYVYAVVQKVQPTVIYHLAAQICTTASMRDPKMDAEINIIGTLNLLQAALSFNVGKIIYASSAAVYGIPLYLPIDENHPLNALSAYGVSKAAAEKYVMIYKQFGLDYTILRYANVYGPGQNSGTEGGVVAIFADRFQRKQTVEIFGDGEQTRDFIYVKDVVAANLAALKQGSTGTFNIGSGSRISINALHKTFQKITKLELKPLYRPPRREDIPHSALDSNRAKNLLGWQPQYNLDKGLAELLSEIETGIETKH